MHFKDQRENPFERDWTKTDILAVQSSRPALIYDASDTGRQCYTDAAKAAMLKDCTPMITVIEKALSVSKKPS